MVCVALDNLPGIYTGSVPGHVGKVVLKPLYNYIQQLSKHLSGNDRNGRTAESAQTISVSISLPSTGIVLEQQDPNRFHPPRESTARASSHKREADVLHEVQQKCTTPTNFGGLGLQSRPTTRRSADQQVLFLRSMARIFNPVDAANTAQPSSTAPHACSQ